MLAMLKVVHSLKTLNLFRLPAAYRGGSICLAIQEIHPFIFLT